MTRFTVPDMSCGHCTATIEKAIKQIDAKATVDCNLQDHSVAIASDLPADALLGAIADAGFAPQPA
ncbi:heavy-metal-associated domain-containing protein [Tropicimonas sp. IMCC34043]|uniref:heavy-metal-associated domain-containing protein n=1 Tax=Tropicimonas sp. IMCC34043 TaxID=2248760 RepID=UPI000E24D899|nr:heavy-metal-associated domain-containing protein [Tropicimonas sp. IMCC34043]